MPIEKLRTEFPISVLPVWERNIRGCLSRRNARVGFPGIV